MRALVQRETPVRLRVDDEGGLLVDADAVPTVEVRDGAGALVESPTATTEGTGIYKVVLSPRDEVDRLTVTWSYDVGGYSRVSNVHVDVVGSRLVELWRLREDQALTGVSTLTLHRVADAVEDWFSSALGFPPVLQHVRRTFRLDGNSVGLDVPGVLVPDELYAASREGDALGAADLAAITVEDGEWVWDDGRLWAAGLWTVHGSHGWANPPEDLRRAAATFASYIAKQNKLPERAASVVTEGSVITFALPTPERPTGLPEVDAVLNRLRLPAYV